MTHIEITINAPFTCEGYFVVASPPDRMCSHVLVRAVGLSWPRRCSHDLLIHDPQNKLSSMPCTRPPAALPLPHASAMAMVCKLARTCLDGTLVRKAEGLSHY